MFANMAGSVIVATTLTCCVLGIFFAKPEKSNKLLSVCWGCKSLPFAQIGVRGCLRFALAEYSDYDGIGFEQYCYHKVACVGGEKTKGQAGLPVEDADRNISVGIYRQR